MTDQATAAGAKFSDVSGSPVREKRDLLEQHAREKLGVGEDWRLYRWQSQPIEAKESTHVLVSGAVCRVKFKAGPRKGRTNWSKRDITTDCTVSIMNAEHDQWLVEWERRTGNCYKCQGEGRAWAGWSVKDGNRYRPCRRCAETGKAPGNDQVSNSGLETTK